MQVNHSSPSVGHNFLNATYVFSIFFGFRNLNYPLEFHRPYHIDRIACANLDGSNHLYSLFRLGWSNRTIGFFPIVETMVLVWLSHSGTFESPLEVVEVRCILQFVLKCSIFWSTHFKGPIGPKPYKGTTLYCMVLIFVTAHFFTCFVLICLSKNVGWPSFLEFWLHDVKTFVTWLKVCDTLKTE